MTESPNARVLEAEVLLNVARLPLVSADALQRLTGAPADAVRRALQTLERYGWIDFV